MKWEPAGSRMWHGYPQPMEAHSERPWWRREERRWVRVDGRAAPDEHGEVETQGFLRVRPRTGPDLAAIDALEPLDAPPPLVGQVWVETWEDDEGPDLTHRRARMVTMVHETCGVVEHVWFADSFGGVPRLLALAEWQHDRGERALVPVAGAWPPPGAVLVAGPLSPWAEMGASEKSDNVRNP